MNFPAELKYTKDHEWIKVEGDVAIVGKKKMGFNVDYSYDAFPSDIILPRCFPLRAFRCVRKSL